MYACRVAAGFVCITHTRIYSLALARIIHTCTPIAYTYTHANSYTYTHSVRCAVPETQRTFVMTLSYIEKHIIIEICVLHACIFQYEYFFLFFGLFLFICCLFFPLFLLLSMLPMFLFSFRFVCPMSIPLLVFFRHIVFELKFGIRLWPDEIFNF